MWFINALHQLKAFLYEEEKNRNDYFYLGTTAKPDKKFNDSAIFSIFHQKIFYWTSSQKSSPRKFL